MVSVGEVTTHEDETGSTHDKGCDRVRWPASQSLSEPCEHTAQFCVLTFDTSFLRTHMIPNTAEKANGGRALMASTGATKELCGVC